ncbi:30S ribosomal protein S8 [Candidatus Vidania fulgoroideae]|uniref:Small ribosomal subunit protein uS8 n=1 Tax=Candidatus Vidania fulgoroideorum TaxID=881286 RepID=A0A974XE42_9PROT|nr:30S ribosomal protein S8 [Candidatus Vidania fulgoroideae]
MYNFHLSDFISRFNNCIFSSKKILYLRNSIFILSIIKFFKIKGYISKFTCLGKNILVIISYKGNLPVVRKIKIVSKPGRRVYSKVKDLSISSFYNEVFSTDIGIVDTKYAISINKCGEFLFKIYLNV